MKKGLRSRRGKLIVIDGSDGSGKTTQWELLKKRFRKEKISCETIDFPVYSSFFGKFIKRYLHGEFGDPVKLDSYHASFSYALDRFFYKEKIEKALNKGKIVLANRYTTSNKILQGAKLRDKKEKERYWRWLDNLEYKKLGISKPDLVLYLFVPVKISKDLVKSRAQNNKKIKIDKHESNIIYQKKVVLDSKFLCNKNRNWKLINCTEESKLLSKRGVHEKVWNVIKKVI